MRCEPPDRVQAQAGRAFYQQKIQRQQKTAAQISVRKAAARNLVTLILVVDLVQKPIVENERRAETEICDDE